MPRHKKTTHGGYVIENIRLDVLRRIKKQRYVIDFKRLGKFFPTKPAAICAYVKRTHKRGCTQAIDLKSLHEIRATQTAVYPIDFKSEYEIRTSYPFALRLRQPRLTHPRHRANLPTSLQNQRCGVNRPLNQRRTAPTIFV